MTPSPTKQNMKTEISKENCLALLSRLASKELTFGCRVNYEGYAYVREKMEDYITVIRVRGDGAFQAIEQDGSPILESVTSCGRTYDEVAWQKLKKESEILGHDIMLGDVLEKMYQMQEERKDEAFPNSKISIGEKCAILVTNENERQELLRLWSHCGFTKSLQSILSEAKWEARYKCDLCGQSGEDIQEFVLSAKGFHKCSSDKGGTTFSPDEEAPKQPHIKNLFQLLLTLGL